MADSPASASSTRGESRVIYGALAGAGLGAVVGLAVVAGNPHLRVSGPGSFGLAAACTTGVVAAVVSARGYVLSRAMRGQEWRGGLTTATRAVATAAVVIAHTAMAFLGTYALFVVLSKAVIGMRVHAFFGAVLMALAVAVTTYMVARSVARTTTQRMTSLLMSFVVVGTLTSAVTTSDPLWWTVHFSQLGTYGDLSSWIFNGTLVAGGLLVATFAVYLAHDMSALVASGTLTNPAAPATVPRLFVIMGVMLAIVGVVPVDVSFAVHSAAASGMAVVFLILLARGRALVAGLPAGYFTAAWVFLGATVCGVALFLGRALSVTAFEVTVFGLIFGWIAVFIGFLGTASDTETAQLR